MSYSQKELKIGTIIENESTRDTALAKNIAMRNLSEDANHYRKLRKSAGGAGGIGIIDNPGEYGYDGSGYADQTVAGYGADNGAMGEGAMTSLENGMAEQEGPGGDDSTSSHFNPLKSSDVGKLAPGQSPVLKSSELMDECGCEPDSEFGDLNVAQGPSVKVVKVSVGQGGDAPPAKPLTSSNLGNGGKPLTSDTLQAPNGDNTIETLPNTPAKIPAQKTNTFADSIADEEGNAKTNSVRIGKTPGVAGQADALNHFTGLISKALKPEIPRRMEFIPANVSENKKNNITEETEQERYQKGIYNPAKLGERWRIDATKKTKPLNEIDVDVLKEYTVDKGKKKLVLGIDHGKKFVSICANCDDELGKERNEKDADGKPIRMPFTARMRKKGYRTSHGVCPYHFDEMMKQIGSDKRHDSV